MSAIVELREGDVFRFHYSDAVRQRWRTDTQWCFDGQVVVRRGKLCDTYWGFDASDPRVVTPEEGELTLVCNLGDVRDVKEYEARHYLETDVFNLTHHHGYHKRFVVRKDAQRNSDRMMAEVEKRISEIHRQLESAVRFAGYDLTKLGELRAKIHAGDLTVNLWW